MTSPHSDITIVLGPTAVGKTSFSLDLAEAHGGHIISADAFQVYRGMDIGTAKVSREDQARVPHYLIDILSPDTPYSVADFTTRCDGLLGFLRSAHTPAIICGGTAFYLNAFLYEYQFLNQVDSETHMESVRQDLERYGLPHLVKELLTLDPECQTYLDVHNDRRVVRALAIYRMTGARPSELRQRSQRPRADVRVLGLRMERTRLIERIHHRVDQMLSMGWVDEVKGLLDSGVSPDCPGFEAIGYREIASYLKGDLTYDAMIDLIKIKTRQFSKRQMTWYRKFDFVEWTDVT